MPKALQNMAKNEEKPCSTCLTFFDSDSTTVSGMYFCNAIYCRILDIYNKNKGLLLHILVKPLVTLAVSQEFCKLFDLKAVI